MAEIINAWPPPKGVAAAQFVYPWRDWCNLDENGHGDIWLAEQGVDFPEDMVPANFRGVLYNRANRVTKIREKEAPLVPKRVTVRSKVTGQTRETIRRVPDFSPMKVKVVIVSPEQVAFQFYDSPEPPPPPALVTAFPRRRKPLHQRRNRRVLEKV